MQLAPVPLRNPTILQGSPRSYSQVLCGGGETATPSHLLSEMGIWHLVFFYGRDGTHFCTSQAR